MNHQSNTTPQIISLSQAAQFRNPNTESPLHNSAKKATNKKKHQNTQTNTTHRRSDDNSLRLLIGDSPTVAGESVIIVRRNERRLRRREREVPPKRRQDRPSTSDSARRRRLNRPAGSSTSARHLAALRLNRPSPIAATPIKGRKRRLHLGFSQPNLSAKREEPRRRARVWNADLRSERGRDRKRGLERESGGFFFFF